MKKITALLLVMIMLALPSAAFAAGKASLSFSEEVSAYSGEQFTVTVTFTADQEIGTLQAEFTYDPTLMEFVSGGNAAYAEDGRGSIAGNGGAQILSYALDFRALKTGSGEIEITSSELIGSEGGKLLGRPTGAIGISVGERPAVMPEPSEDPIPELTPPPQTVPEKVELTVIDGKKYIPMKSGIEGYMLLGDEEGKLWLYRTADGSLSEYLPFAQNGLYFAAELPALESYAPAKVTIGGREYDAYASGTESYYYIRLIDASGEAAWYCCDAQSGMLGRAEVTENTVEREYPNEKTGVYDLAVIILAVLNVLAVIGLIVVIRRKRR